MTITAPLERFALCAQTLTPYTVTPEGRCFRLVLADGRTGLFTSDADAHEDAARLAAVDARGVWGLVRGYANKE